MSMEDEENVVADGVELNEVAKAEDPSGLPIGKDGRPWTKIIARLLPETLDFAERALLRATAPVYQSGGRLITPIRYNRVDQLEELTEDEHLEPLAAPALVRQSGTMLLHEVMPPLLLENFALSATWFKLDQRSEKWKASLPSLDFARAFVARGQWKLRTLTGVIEAPTIRNDGSILEREGYDKRSGVYLDTNGVLFPAVPVKPSKQHARDALDLLMDIIKDFPFVPDDGSAVWRGKASASRSVALSTTLTGMVRKSLATAPAHAQDAVVMATGKTLLSNCSAIPVTGRRATVISASEDRAEMSKRLFAVLLQGDTFVSIDNVSHPMESDDFCSILLGPTYQGRILGMSKMATVGTLVTWSINGNQLRFKGDIATRVVMAKLDAGMEDPNQRRFDRNLYEWLPLHRVEICIAALTVVRAYSVAGFPGWKDLESSRFLDWDRMVRGALVWLGEPDSWATRHFVQTSDAKRDAHATLMRAWAKLVGVGEWVTSPDIMTQRMEEGDNIFWTEAGGAELAAAIEGALSSSRAPTTRALSNYLDGIEGRIVDGLVVRADRRRGYTTRYRLTKV